MLFRKTPPLPVFLPSQVLAINCVLRFPPNRHASVVVERHVQFRRFSRQLHRLLPRHVFTCVQPMDRHPPLSLGDRAIQIDGQTFLLEVEKTATGKIKWLSTGARRC